MAEAALRPARRWLVALAAVTTLGGLTHYFFLFVLGAGVVWLWAARPRPPAAGRTTLAIAAGTAVFLPWLPDFLEQQAHGRYRWIGPCDPAAVAKLPGELFFGPDGFVYGLARLAVTAALIAGAIVLWWRGRKAASWRRSPCSRFSAPVRSGPPASRSSTSATCCRSHRSWRSWSRRG
jgi:hypothetical protein